MTSLFIYLFGRQPWFSTISKLADERQEPHRQRNRLRKEPPFEAFYSCDDLLDIIRSQSFLTSYANDSDSTVLYQDASESLPPDLQPSMISPQLDDSISLYSQNAIKPEELRRTRAKTPVFRIGQLEEKICMELRDTDPAQMLAKQYQEELPSRGITPCPSVNTPATHQNSLRRIKCHESLRDIVKSHPEDTQSSTYNTLGSSISTSMDKPNYSNLHASRQSSFGEDLLTSPKPPRPHFFRGSFESHSTRRHSSDSETLLGSDSEMSPHSPTSRSPTKTTFANSNFEGLETIQDCLIPNTKEAYPKSDNDITMQLCMDLLTNDLANALYRQHPAEQGNRASGLQILLMIEAYEALQQKIRQEQQSHVTDDVAKHVRAADDALDHWLQALRSIYERSISRNDSSLRDSVHF